MLNQFNNLLKNKKIITILVVMIIIGMLPVKTYAHNAFFLQALIDEDTMQYYGAVVNDKANFTNSEKKHIEASLGNFSEIKDFTLSGASSGAMGVYQDPDDDDEVEEFKPDGGRYKDFDKKNNGKSSMVFTFPPKEIRRPSKNNASAKDSQRAFEIRDTLIPNINEVLYLINDSKPYDNIEELITASEYIDGSSKTTDNGWDISYSGDMINISKGNRSFDFVYKMSKGYTDSKFSTGEKSYVYNSKYDYSDDVSDITMKDLIVQANYTALVKGVLVDQAGEYTKPGTIEQKLSEFIISAVDGLRNFLGLYNIQELVYNEGVRGRSRFYYGVLPYEWLAIALAFHSIFKGIALLMVVVSFIRLIMMREIATVNPSKRITLRNGIIDIFATAVLLGFNLTLIYAMMLINSKIVDVFAATIPETGGMLGAMTGNQTHFTFAGAIMKAYYLFIGLYLNGVYIYRSFTTMVLIASAPYYIAQISFGDKKKQSFGMWWKELFANIFIQSFHAFILSMFAMVQGQVRGIELALISFALIPLTKKLRSFMLGGTGISDELGMAPILAGAGLAAGIGKSRERAKKELEREGGPVNSGTENFTMTNNPDIHGSTGSSGNGPGSGPGGGSGGSGAPIQPTIKDSKIDKQFDNMNGVDNFSNIDNIYDTDGMDSIDTSPIVRANGEPIDNYNLDDFDESFIGSHIDPYDENDTIFNNEDIEPSGMNINYNNDGVDRVNGSEKEYHTQTNNSNNSEPVQTIVGEKSRKAEASSKESGIDKNHEPQLMNEQASINLNKLKTVAKTGAVIGIGTAATMAYGHENSSQRIIGDQLGKKSAEIEEDFASSFKSPNEKVIAEEMYNQERFNIDSTM